MGQNSCKSKPQIWDSHYAQGAIDKDGNAVQLSATVTGATGAVGRCVVGELLSSPLWHRIVTIGRRKLDQKDLPPKYASSINLAAEEKSGRLVQHAGVDFEDLKTTTDLFNDSPVSFCCLGSTTGQGDEIFKKVDYTYVTNVATMAKTAGARHFSLVSTTGADANSMFIYFRTKGQADKKIQDEIGFDSLHIYRPGPLDRGDKVRFKEKFIMFMAVKCEVVASAMRRVAELNMSQLQNWTTALPTIEGGLDGYISDRIHENSSFIPVSKW